MLLIPEPSLFYCDLDEDYFFAWLKSISAVKIVTGAPGGLELTIDEPIDRASFYELVGLMTRYGLDTQCLKPLCESNPDSWFKDNKNYWHAAVFSKGDS